MTKLKIENKLCVHCGACTAVCSSDALSIDTLTSVLNFKNEKCNQCSQCIDACPLRAIIKE